MLREIKKVSQKRDEPRRRWFTSQDIDLFVWLNNHDEVVSYHLTYNRPHDEKALVWSKEKGFTHLGVDDGSRPGKHPGSPLLVQDGVINPIKIVSMIKKNSGELGPSIEDFIISGIEKHFK